MKNLKIRPRFIQTASLIVITTLLAGCTTMQGPSSGAQVSGSDVRPTSTAQARSSSPGTPLIAPPTANKQLSAPASAAPAAGAVATISYQELVKLSAEVFGNEAKVIGKVVSVTVNGKGDLGYFAKKSDWITFVCKSGEKTLTANKVAKGPIRGRIFDIQGWEGTVVYHLNDCQRVK